ncbi:hypothetical protein OAX11_05255 [Flavobacteriaceae bacterium]|nr:hypothetical protein [Flavobacteriaceae bacterium]
MKINNKYKATIIGSITTLLSFVSTWTYAIPILTIIPLGLSLENLFSGENYQNTSIKVFISLIILFILIGFWFYKKLVSDRKESNGLNISRMMLFFLVQFFIIHPLVFYLWASLNSEHSGDGQFIFGIVKTFPISSFSFVIFGLIIDSLMNKKNVC